MKCGQGCCSGCGAFIAGSGSGDGVVVPAIARLVQADDDSVRDVIHRFDEAGGACLASGGAGGRPRLIGTDDEDFVVQTATTRPTWHGQPFTGWELLGLATAPRSGARAIQLPQAGLVLGG
ncbi:helix-turn-helix domain-containing protein [Nocardia asiatica]|uniref:helix-turn-helix domain-containing protein n=1 Tax=Nocardia asiatica TaxID=209252 RepID=UPI003EDEE9B6